MKKAAGNILLVISVVLIIFLFSHSLGPDRYNDLILDKEAYEAIISSREERTDLRVNIRFDEESLFYDESSHLYFYSLVEGSKTSYNPYVQLAGASDAKIAILCEPITEPSIKENVTIPFIVYTNDSYCCYGLKCTTLPLLGISCSDEIGDENISMSITAFDNQKSAVSRTVQSNGVIRIRGGSTRDFPKKGYRFSLLTDSLGGNIRANHISLFGLRQDDDWLLYAAYNDQEKIRNVFSSNLWEYSCAKDNAYNINTGMEYKYLELFINGRYWGLYALGYPIDEKQLEMDGNTDTNALYKKIGWDKEKQIAYPGGYELKTTKYSNADDSVIDDSAWELLYRYYYELARNVKETDQLRQGIDLDNAADFMLFCNLVQGIDNVNESDCIKNLYLSLRKRVDSIYGLYCPWDLDITWGNSWVDGLETNHVIPYGIEADYHRIMRHGYLYQMIVNGDSYTLDDLLDKYWTLRSDVWSEDNLLSMLDLYEAHIYDSGAYLREMDRWPDGTYADPDDGLNTFKIYVTERLKATDRYYKRLEQLRDETLYVKRSAQYEDFLGCDFIVEINEKLLLEDDNYADLLKYIGIDLEKITADVHYIVASPSTDTYEYLPSDENEEEESYYTVYVNGTPYYFAKDEKKPVFRLFLINGATVETLYFSTDFTCSPQIATFRDPKLYAEALAFVDGIAIIQIGNPDFWQDNSYVTLFTELGVVNVVKETTAIIYNFKQHSGVVVNGVQDPEMEVDTDFGKVTCWNNENDGLIICVDEKEFPLEVSSEFGSDFISCTVISENLETVLDNVIWQFDINDTQKRPKVLIKNCLRPETTF